MNLEHFNVKIFVDGESSVDSEKFIEVFHRWVAQQTMNELLIDVADYRHVPDGPGVVMVGQEADYSMSNDGGRHGLVYNRKAPLEGTNGDRFRQALGSAAKACGLLETEFDGLKFSCTELEWCINDRALAPNIDETRAGCDSEIRSILANVSGDTEPRLTYNSDPRSRFGAVVTFSKPLDLAKLASSA